MTTLNVIIDGQSYEAPVRISIVAALALMGSGVTRRLVNSQLCTPFCGVGVYQECHITVSGRRVLACQMECQPEMVIEGNHHAKR